MEACHDLSLWRSHPASAHTAPPKPLHIARIRLEGFDGAEQTKTESTQQVLKVFHGPIGM